MCRGLIKMPAQVANSPKPNKQPASTTPGKSPNGTVTKSLADILVKMKALDSTRAKQVKLAEVQTGKPQEDIIRSQNLTTEENIVRAKAELYNIPFTDLATIPVNPEAIALLPQEVAERFEVFPISVNKQEKSLVLAMAKPLNLTAIEFIEQKTGLRVKPHAAVPEKIQEYIITRYSTTLSQQVTEALKEVSPERTRTTQEFTRTGLIREEKIAEIVSHVLQFAIRSRASDVHIEPQENVTRVRYRIDGILQEKLTIPKGLHSALISRIKILSGLKIDEKRVPQDGRFNFKSGSDEVDLRVSSLPTTWGEKIVMRLLKKSGGVPDLQELGLRGRALKNLEDAILRPHGIVLICGPTGSGKTTTLYSLVSKLNTPKVNIITLEDPIEYKIPGVNQVQVNTAAGLSFSSGLRSFLRQDPDIILVGEIRDQETADLAIQAALTGHLVFSTLHTNDASGALPRLLDMGAEPYLLSSSISAIVAQRVVRKIHEKCKAPYEPEASVLEEMKTTLGPLWNNVIGNKNKAPIDGAPKVDVSQTLSVSGVNFYKGKGDQECSNSGYFGRVGIFEVLPVTEKISRLILERGASIDIEKTAREEGMISLKQDGYMKVFEGVTTVDEILRVAQE